MLNKTLSAAVFAMVLAGAAMAQDETPLPRGLTEQEREYLRLNPLEVNLRAVTPPPAGAVRAVAEYEPMDGLIISWRGGTSLTNILAQMAASITTTGNANLYVAVVSSTQAAAQAALQAAGANMGRVQFVVRNTDSIWMRDYGPRYIYQGATRAIVAHTYNRPRANDNVFSQGFSTFKGHAYYEAPLIHGGGNYHLNQVGQGNATLLIANENPALTPQQIIDIWSQYWRTNTTLYTPFPTSVDSTQHIDMWMQVAGPSRVFISNWDANPGSTQAIICDNAAAYMASLGYSVVRLPARLIGGVHYTYTNMVMVNNLVLLPSYTNASVSGLNAGALATVQAALPGKAVVQIPCENIVGLAGVMHCIVMHVPLHGGGPGVNGLSPTAYLQTLRGGQTVFPGASVAINYNTDDDKIVTGVNLALSVDGGATWTTLATGLGNGSLGNGGSFSWSVPVVTTPQARIRVTAIDADGNSGSDMSAGNFRIAGPCVADTNGDGQITFADLNTVLGQFGSSATAGSTLAGDVNGDGQVTFSDLNIVLGAFGQNC